MAITRARRLPLFARIALFLLIGTLGVAGARLLPSTLAEGWVPGLSLIAALGLVAGALIEIVRLR